MINECHFAFDREEREHAFNSKHQQEWEWNWQESLKRWKALGAYIGEYHHYPQEPFKYVPLDREPYKFKNYYEEQAYALSLVMKTLKQMKEK
jgi:hypothetical protein